MKYLRTFENNNTRWEFYVEFLKEKLAEDNIYLFEHKIDTNSVMIKLEEYSFSGFSVSDISKSYKKLHDVASKYNVKLYKYALDSVCEFYFLKEENEIIEEELTYRKYNL